MKKQYIHPSCLVVDMVEESSILVGSGQGDGEFKPGSGSESIVNPVTANPDGGGFGVKHYNNNLS